MPDRNLTFAGKSIRDFGVGISGTGTYAKPQRRVTKVSIPGRNGELSIDEGAFDNVTISYDSYIVKGFERFFDDFMAHMLSFSEYQRLEDTYHPRHYRKAVFAGPVEPVTGVLNRSGKFTLEFDCKPQRFLKEGEKTITLTASSNVIRNPTLYPAKPLIRAYGTGSFTVAGISVTILKADGYTDIDCDTEDAYRGSVNCNNNITLNSGYEFPSLPAGEIPVTMSGITRLEITPGWWTI